ncbi:sulfite exporter TauE/SafE family protein [Aquisphaera insulae]|uniref:sulfite exporter TauE/SafE family protein n=1 Tax=Aquisphaera insulae TaxID=2712864 RepID=UPI0013ED2B65|nr:sulfite exporter TauE/SafE family protein [Aquisphaera insulae]
MNAIEFAMMLVLGGVAGICSGMFGIGGGLVIVPLLILIFGFEPKTAIGTSLFAMLLPTGLLGVLEYYRRGELKPIASITIACGLFLGAYVGSRITGAISASTMKRVYGAFLMLVAVYFFWTSSPGRSPATPTPSEPPGDAAVGLGGPRPG